MNSLEKRWNSKESIWFLPSSLTSEQKKGLSEAQKRTQDYKSFLWFSSSGSSARGGLKFYAHTRESLLVSARAVNQHLQVIKEDVFLNSLPLFHVGGFGTWLRAQVAEAKWVNRANEKWKPKNFIETVIDHQVTLSSLVPTQVYDLVSSGWQAPSCLRAVVVGGGSLSTQLYKAARKKGWPLLPSYGMTEFGSQIATASLESLKSTEFPKVRLLPHIDQVLQKPSGVYVKSSAACSLQLEVGKDGSFSLEKKNRALGLLIDDIIEVTPQTKEVQVKGRRDRVVKVKGELISLDSLQQQFNQFLLSQTSSLDLQGFSFGVVACSHERDENELVLMIEIPVKSSRNRSEFFFKQWLQCLESFNSSQPKLLQLVRLEFTHSWPRTPLGKIKWPHVHSAFSAQFRRS